MSSDSSGPSSAPELQGPSPVGSPEIALQVSEAINNHFNLVAYGIAHGPGGEDEYRHLPEVEIEYEGIEEVVNSLDPARGDVLFVEGVGHDPTAESPNQAFQWSEHLDYLKDARSKHSINPSLYAQFLARARGISVVVADLTLQEVEEHNRATGQDAMAHGINPDWPHHEAFHTLRERAVADTIKTYALTSLPSLNGNKPTYALLFGKAHFEKAPGAHDIFDPIYNKSPGIPTAFGQLGLELETRILPDAWDARRRVAMASLVGKLSDFPEAPESLPEH